MILTVDEYMGFIAWLVENEIDPPDTPDGIDSLERVYLAATQQEETDDLLRRADELIAYYGRDPAIRQAMIEAIAQLKEHSSGTGNYTD